MSETHPMDYYGRIRELEARAAKLEAELAAREAAHVEALDVALEAACRPLSDRIAQLEAFIVDACREKTLHGSTPSLIAGASRLGIAAFEAWWAERAAEESKP